MGLHDKSQMDFAFVLWQFHRYDDAQRSDQTTHISDAQLWRSNALEGRTKCQISSAKRRAFLFNFTV